MTLAKEETAWKDSKQSLQKDENKGFVLPGGEMRALALGNQDLNNRLKLRAELHERIDQIQIYSKRGVKPQGLYTREPTALVKYRRETTMTIRHRFMLVLASAILCGCAGVGPLPTPSGNPEVTINSGNTKHIKELLVANLASHGFAIQQDTEYALGASKPLEGSGAVLYQAALGNAYSSPPQVNVSITIAPVGSSTKVYGRIAVGMQGAFGQNQGTDLTHGKSGRELQAMLDQTKTQSEYKSPAG